MTNFDSTTPNGVSLKTEQGLPRENNPSLPLQVSRQSHLLRTDPPHQLRSATLQISLSFQFEADFADIFEVRGTKRAKKGDRLSDCLDGDTAVLSYRGLDNVSRKNSC